MGLDWSHPAESTKQHHPASSGVESPKEGKEGTPKKQLATEH